MMTQTDLNQYMTTTKNTKGAIKMNTNELPTWIKDGLTQKDGKEFDQFIQVVSTKFLNEILDDPEIDFLSGYKINRINDLIQARYNNRYAYAPIDEYLIPKTKKEAIEHIKEYLKVKAFGSLKFNVPVEYAGVYVDTIHVKIEVGRDPITKEVSKKTSDLQVEVNHKDIKGLNNVKKALANYEQARDIELCHLELVF